MNGRPMSGDELYNDLIRRIVNWELRPGQLISETQIAEEYGVSRTVIRSAFTRLKEIKFIEVRPQRGTYVSLIDLHSVDNLLVLRISVEKELAREVLNKLDDESFKELMIELRENLKKQDRLLEKGITGKEFTQYDEEFHKIIAQSINREEIMEIIGGFMLHIYRWRNYYLSTIKGVETVVKEHNKIVDALEAKDEDKVLELIGLHLTKIAGVAERAARKTPEFFIW